MACLSLTSESISVSAPYTRPSSRRKMHYDYRRGSQQLQSDDKRKLIMRLSVTYECRDCCSAAYEVLRGAVLIDFVYDIAQTYTKRRNRWTSGDGTDRILPTFRRRRHSPAIPSSTTRTLSATSNQRRQKSNRDTFTQGFAINVTPRTLVTQDSNTWPCSRGLHASMSRRRQGLSGRRQRPRRG